MNAGAGFRQAFKGIAVIQSPDDDVLHRVHAEIVDVMLQNHGDPVLADASRHVIEYRLCLFCAAGVVAVHIPVEILEARVLHRPGQTKRSLLAVGEIRPEGRTNARKQNDPKEAK